MVVFSALERICGGTVIRQMDDRPVLSIFLDSRKAIASPTALFVALRGPRNDGHRFIPALYEMGIRQFIVEQDDDLPSLAEASILKVPSSLTAFQKLVAWHRAQFSLPVIGITGSNAKTIVKEWLYQLLSVDFNTVKNPGSYNSQTGVALSVWEINTYHQLALFEAGISKPGEMTRLQEMIRPTIGVFTNIGPAHDEGFKGTNEKIAEKLVLFADAEVIVYASDQAAVASAIEASKKPGQKLLGWGSDPAAAVHVVRQQNDRFQLTWQNTRHVLTLPFSDAASVENAWHCITVMLGLGYAPEKIQERIALLRTVPMRLELKQGINGCQLIDDTYNNDLSGLQIALDFLSGIQRKKSTLILSDIFQSGLPGEELAERILAQVVQAKVNAFIGIGPVLTTYRALFERVIPSSFFPTTEAFLQSAELGQFFQEVILVKGARSFGFEQIVQRLQRKIHGTVMEVDLGAMVYNLNYFKSGLKPSVKIMAMVKAFAYGSGSEEVANLLQYHGIDYLGVAYPDEGTELRKNNIRLPIMVMNPSEESFATLLAHELEPEIYSPSILKSFAAFLNGRAWKIHLKLDTGMHRLGFEEADLDGLIATLQATPGLQVASVFSHLAGADDAAHDDFTRQQAERFIGMSSRLINALAIKPILHLLNSSGILRFPEYQFGMVRLGIGLYGVNPTTNQNQLIPVATLKTIISQIKTIKAGDSIGYGRSGTAANEMKIATIAIGYADGFSRSFSGGKGEVMIRGKRAPVIGNVCMDMTMVDVTGIPAAEGDEVIIFGKDPGIDELARTLNTIPYEILTGTSERVKRVFFAESI